MIELSEKEKKVLKVLIEGIPILKHPFYEISKKTGLEEEEVLKIIKRLLGKKIIRRLGITLRHNFVGIEGNAMVAWKVPEEKIEKVGEYLATLPYVSHCYIRKAYEDWNFNLYTMIHGKDREEVKKRIEEISKKFNLTEYETLFTQKEIIRKNLEYEF